MGWNVVPENMEARFGRVTEAQQAKYTIEAYERIKSEWLWIGVANYWFLKRPSDSEKDQSWYYFRLLEPDFTPLPVYDALVTYANTALETQEIAEWLRVWQSLRPLLFFAGAALSFFSLLMLLAPHGDSASP